MPPIGKLDAGRIDDTMALVGVCNAVYIVGDDDRVVAVKRTMFAVGGAKVVEELGNRATGISC